MTITDRRDAERARRKNEILDAARSTFAQDGFRRTTVDAIARRAEVAKGTIYLYFESREAILAELTLRALGDLTTHLQAASDAAPVLNPDQKLREIAAAYLAFALHSPDYFRLLNALDRGDFQEGLSTETRQELAEQSRCALELVRQAFADGIELGLFYSGDPTQFAGILWAALNGSLALMANSLRRGLLASDLPQLYDATVELVLRGARADYHEP